VRAKPRGSVRGLKKNREDLKSFNTEALMAVIAQLRIEKPTGKWSYKEVWSRAGLKSQIALNSPWNSHVRAEIEKHNARLRNSPAEDFPTASGKDLLGALREELRSCRAQRDQALSQIAQFAADTEYFKKQYLDLKKIVDRLRSEPAEVKSRFISER